MSESTGKHAYEIFQTVMQDAQYHILSNEYKEKLDALQAQIGTFSKKQWQVIDEYLDISLRVHQAMMEIALQTPPIEQK